MICSKIHPSDHKGSLPNHFLTKMGRSHDVYVEFPLGLDISGLKTNFLIFHEGSKSWY